MFLPAFSIRTTVDTAVEFNNVALFKAAWYVNDVEEEDIQSIPCAELINSWTDMGEV